VPSELETSPPTSTELFDKTTGQNEVAHRISRLLYSGVKYQSWEKSALLVWGLVHIDPGQAGGVPVVGKFGGFNSTLPLLRGSDKMLGTL